MSSLQRYLMAATRLVTLSLLSFLACTLGLWAYNHPEQVKNLDFRDLHPSRAMLTLFGIQPHQYHDRVWQALQQPSGWSELPRSDALEQIEQQQFENMGPMQLQ